MKNAIISSWSDPPYRSLCVEHTIPGKKILHASDPWRYVAIVNDEFLDLIQKVHDDLPVVIDHCENHIWTNIRILSQEAFRQGNVGVYFDFHSDVTITEGIRLIFWKNELLYFLENNKIDPEVAGAS